MDDYYIITESPPPININKMKSEIGEAWRLLCACTQYLTTEFNGSYPPQDTQLLGRSYLWQRHN